MNIHLLRKNKYLTETFELKDQIGKDIFRNFETRILAAFLSYDIIKTEQKQELFSGNGFNLNTCSDYSH